MNIAELTEILEKEGCSCAIWGGGELTLCHRRGVADLYELLTSSPGKLRGALVADKIVGKGAAALMVIGGVSQVYAGVISDPALEMLHTGGVTVICGKRVPNIINREGTGICPVETLCLGCRTADECLPLIENFLKSRT